MSKFLLTRVWSNSGDSYDCGDDSEVVQFENGHGCSATDFDPSLLGGSYFSVPVSVPASLRAIEGISLVPVADDKSDQGSILNIYLVE
jgi:hypothetical protein